MSDLKILFKSAPLALLLIAALLLAGCGGDEAPSAATEGAAQATTVITTTLPTTTTDVIALVSPLAPSSPLPTPAEKPVPTSDTGSIVGRILINRPEGQIAVADILIGLAEVIRDENGVAKVGGYEPSNTIRVYTDAYGRFVMNDVKPGTYTLILDAVVNQSQLSDDKTGNTILAEVKAGEVTDLGTLNYSSLPIPGFN